MYTRNNEEDCEKSKYYIENFDNEIIILNILPLNPYINNFPRYKRTLLEEVACILANNPTLKVKSLIALPYDNSELSNFELWMIVGMIDLSQEFL